MLLCLYVHAYIYICICLINFFVRFRWKIIQEIWKEIFIIFRVQFFLISRRKINFNLQLRETPTCSFIVSFHSRYKYVRILFLESVGWRQLFFFTFSDPEGRKDKRDRWSKYRHLKHLSPNFKRRVHFLFKSETRREQMFPNLYASKKHRSRRKKFLCTGWERNAAM